MANDAPLARPETEMHLVMTGRVASHTIGISGVTQNINVVEIGTSTIDKAISAAGRDIDNIGMVSMDSLFCPYVIGINWEDHSSLPHWEEPASGTVTATNLNPFNPARSMTSASIFYESGPNLGIYNSVETLGEGDFCQFKNLVPNDQSEVSLRLNSIKAVGFKAPLILTGWGYDINDNPVPADSGNPTAFASGAFRNPALWKSGPLDARWDEARQVWSAGVATGTTSGGGDCNCGCSCAEGYDLVLPDGTKTTRVLKWVPPSDLEIDVANGHIWLPQANEIDTLPNLAQYYPLVYASGSAGTWTLNASGYLRARYSDYISEVDGSTVRGSAATSGVTKTGSITFLRQDTTDPNLMSLTVTINGTIAPTGS